MCRRHNDPVVSHFLKHPGLLIKVVDIIALLVEIDLHIRSTLSQRVSFARLIGNSEKFSNKRTLAE